MSLILEALRKSEAERRRGEAPGLRVELPPVPAPRERRLPALAIVAVAAAVGLLLGFALLWPRLADDADADSPVAAAEPVPEMPASPSPSSPAPAAALETAPGPSASATSDFPRVDRIEPATEVPAARPPTASPIDPVAIEPLRPPAAAPAMPTHAAAVTVEPPAQPHAAPVTTAGESSIRITGLPTAQRERLPAMKLSLHMWNEDAARRFAVIDGQRRSEGDRVGDATITTIDREGVLLELDGQVVRVPLP